MTLPPEAVEGNMCQYLLYVPSILGTFPHHLISAPQQPYRVSVAIVTIDVSKPKFQEFEELSVNIVARG